VRVRARIGRELWAAEWLARTRPDWNITVSYGNGMIAGGGM
jgi:hypothetical protein